MSRTLFNVNVQPVIIRGSGNKPTVPSPSDLTPTSSGWLATDIMKGEVAYNPDDNIFYYRNDSDVIEELSGGTTDMDLMIEGSTNLILTNAERTKLAGIQAGATATGVSEFYVDKINGSDYNTGDTWDQAFETWTALYENVTANSKIYIARGSVFTPDDYPDPADVPVEGGHTESLFVAGGMAAVINAVNARWDGVEIDAYGMGDYPMFDLRKTLLNAGFVKEGGYTNIYRMDFDRVQQDNFGSEYGGCWEDEWVLRQHVVGEAGVNANYNHDTEGEALTAVDGEPGSYYFKITTGLQASSYYIHARDSSNLISNGLEYKIRYFDWFITNETGNTDFVSRKGIKVSNCKTKGNAMHMGAVWGKNIECYNLTVLEFARHGVMVHGYMEDCKVIRGNYLFGGAMYHAFSTYQGEGRHMVYKRCLAVAKESKEDAGASVAAYYYHGQAGSSYNTVEYDNCTAINCNRAFTIDSNMKYIKITNPIVMGCLGFLFNITPKTSTKCKIDVNGGEMVAVSIANQNTFIEVVQVELNIHNFKVFFEGNHCFKLHDTDDAEINIYDSLMVFENSLAYDVFRIYSNTASPTIRLVNCVFCNTTAGQKGFMEVESGSDPDLYIENCHFEDFSILGETDLMVLNYTNPGVSYPTCQIGLVGLLEGNPRYRHWSIDQDVIGEDVYAGTGISMGNTRGYLDIEDIPYEKL